jgi:HD-GYP domain-containing protein (c-di-GMP phosphodiesterase class II)
MVLGRSVYDTRGQMVLQRGTRLADEHLTVLARAATTEILIEDPRVADVPVGALFPDDLEAKAVRALHVLLVLKDGVTEGITTSELNDVQTAVHQMVDVLFPVALGDPDLSTSCSPQGYDHLHPVKVAELSLVIGREAGLSREELVSLGLAAILQNVGYLALPLGLLEASGPLADEEGHLRRHPEHSVNLLASAGLPAEAVRAIKEHHERWNGSGYPQGLKRDEISPLARILGMADTYHSLLSKRPHRQEIKPHEAVEFIVAYSGDLFDPDLARIFVRRIPQYPAGLGVRLSTGETGIVSNPNLGHIARPVVRVCVANGKPVARPYDIDLSEPEHMQKIIAEVLL